MQIVYWLKSMMRHLNLGHQVHIGICVYQELEVRQKFNLGEVKS